MSTPDAAQSPEKAQILTPYSDAWIDLCAATGRPSGVATNAEALKAFPLGLRRMIVEDGIALISDDLRYPEAVAQSIRQWRDAALPPGSTPASGDAS